MHARKVKLKPERLLLVNRKKWRWERVPLLFIPWVGKILWRRAWQPHSSVLAWRIPWREEPGGLQSTVLQRVGHD